MTIPKKTKGEVRERAVHKCEYCGITETELGGELTIDHYQPTSKGGDNRLENLVYCCHRCNSYKHDYFPETEDMPSLWNPRLESASQHFIELEDGYLEPLTKTGKLAIQILKLNRLPLVAHRFHKRMQSTEYQLLNRLYEINSMISQINPQLAELSEEQQHLLKEQQEILKKLTK